jgi:hypothetical protein
VSGPPFVLADRARAEQLGLLSHTRRLFHGHAVHTDADGVAWAVARVGAHAFAYTWLGQGWAFDPHAAGRWADRLADRREAMGRAGPEDHRRHLHGVARRLRLGPNAERLLWAVHRLVLGSRCSVVRAADFALAAAVWGPAPGGRPRQWRRDLAVLLDGLAWLHVAEWEDGDAPPAWGQDTALLTHAADVRGSINDVCDEHCPGRAGRPHHHFVVNVGRGFLGVLEQFAAQKADGVRYYEFPTGGPREGGPTLRRVGRSGRLASVYLPARLGDPAACAAFTPAKHRLLQALIRDTTRAPRGRRSEPAEPEVFSGAMLPSFSGRSTAACPLLDPAARHVGFNGNKRRRGLGYRLATPGGWLAKAGYPAGGVAAFLADLAALAGPLGLTAVGVGAPAAFFDLDRLRAMALLPARRADLGRLHLRVYTRADFVTRWNALFGWEGADAGPTPRPDDPALSLAAAMAKAGVSRRALAAGVGEDPSFLNKVLNGKKPWPAGLLERARAWVEGRGRADAGPAAPWPSVPKAAAAGRTLLDVALAYLRRGWSVVPQRPGEKKPAVRWKPFQATRPSEAQLEAWFRRWPDAGLAVVLGPASDLFVIDVDGKDGHDALLGRLGAEPPAPKALSGSGEPHRFHLYFRCPDLPTTAKATPWHDKLEFRGKGGVVILPPSLHRSGRRYEWAEGRSPADVPLPQLPAEVVAALRPRPKPTPDPASPVFAGMPIGVEASPSTRRFLAGAYADGPEWNDRLFRAACDLAGRGVAREAAEPLLLAGARPWGGAEADAAARTIESAYGRPRDPGRR